MGRRQYDQVLASNRGQILPDNHPIARSVNRVLGRLIPEAPIEGADWRVHVINDDSMANAFVLPGYGHCHVGIGRVPLT
jgi:predicted Zn-dependent protease